VAFLTDPDFFSRFDLTVVCIFLSVLLVFELGKVLVNKLRRWPRRKNRTP